MESEPAPYEESTAGLVFHDRSSGIQVPLKKLCLHSKLKIVEMGLISPKVEKWNTLFLAGTMKTVLLGIHRARSEQAVPAVTSSCSLFWLCHHGANMQGPGSPQTAESCGGCCCCCGGGCLGGASSRRAWTVTATWPNPFSSKMCRGKHNCSWGTPIFLQASRKFSTFRLHFAIVNLGTAGDGT